MSSFEQIVVADQKVWACSKCGKTFRDNAGECLHENTHLNVTIDALKRIMKTTIDGSSMGIVRDTFKKIGVSYDERERLW